MLAAREHKPLAEQQRQTPARLRLPIRDRRRYSAGGRNHLVSISIFSGLSAISLM